MKTVPKAVREQVTVEDLRAEVSAFEAAHPGTDRTNYLDVFRDARGELVESDEFFNVDSLYQLLALLEQAS